MTGEEPSSFPQRRLKLDFSRVSTSPKLQALLEGLLEPTWEDRLTIKQAQAVLTGQSRSQQAQRAEQVRSRPSFGDWGWETPRDRSAQSSRSAQVQSPSVHFHCPKGNVRKDSQDHIGTRTACPVHHWSITSLAGAAM